MQHLRIWALACAIALASLACDTSTGPDVAPEQETPLGGWALQTIQTADGALIPSDPERFTLELMDDGRAHVRADCNVCNAGYELDGDSLTFGLMACTLAACPPDSIDDEFRQALGSVSMWQRGGSELALAFDGGTLRFASR